MYEAKSSLADTSIARSLAGGSTPSSIGGSYELVHGELRAAGGRAAGGRAAHVVRRQSTRTRARRHASFGAGSAPVGVAVAIVVAEQVDIFLGVLCHLQRLVDRVEQIIRQVRRQIDQLCGAEQRV